MMSALNGKYSAANLADDWNPTNFKRNTNLTSFFVTFMEIRVTTKHPCKKKGNPRCFVGLTSCTRRQTFPQFQGFRIRQSWFLN